DAVHGAGRAAKVAERPRQGSLRRCRSAGIQTHRHRHLLAGQYRDHAGADLRLRRSLVIYACCNENDVRRAAVLANPTLNGIDFLEVLDPQARASSRRQRTLLVHCLKPAPGGLVPANVLITGGESITGVTAQWIAPAAAPPPHATPGEQTFFSGLPNAAK